MKVLILLLTLTGVLVSFQNCGRTARNTGLVAQGEQLLQESSGCSGSVCSQSADFLWMQIREYEPYKIELATVQGGHFNVAGQCGISNFPKHSFIWELREGFGVQNIVGEGFTDDLCSNGRFVLPIIPNQIALVADQRYTLTIELVGLSETGEEFSNPQPNNQGSLDILFSSEPPL